MMIGRLMASIDRRKQSPSIFLNGPAFLQSSLLPVTFFAMLVKGRKKVMSASAIELPLFPLNVVLFPGMVLPLHIFEPRYRQMIAECVQQKTPFGVVLARPESVPLLEEPYAVGTMADIRDLSQLEDGRYV